MTIASEITRLQNDKSAMCTAIENKGVTVWNASLDCYASCIDAIEQGGGWWMKVDLFMVWWWGWGGRGSLNARATWWGWGGGVIYKQWFWLGQDSYQITIWAWWAAGTSSNTWGYPWWCGCPTCFHDKLIAYWWGGWGAACGGSTATRATWWWGAVWCGIVIRCLWDEVQWTDWTANGGGWAYASSSGGWCWFTTDICGASRVFGGGWWWPWKCGGWCWWDGWTSSTAWKSATSYWWGWGAWWCCGNSTYDVAGSWYQWVMYIRYKTDWSCWIECATWGYKYNCNWYTIHRFTSADNFAIKPKSKSFIYLVVWGWGGWGWGWWWGGAVCYWMMKATQDSYSIVVWGKGTHWIPWTDWGTSCLWSDVIAPWWKGGCREKWGTSWGWYEGWWSYGTNGNNCTYSHGGGGGSNWVGCPSPWYRYWGAWWPWCLWYWWGGWGWLRDWWGAACDWAGGGAYCYAWCVSNCGWWWGWSWNNPYSQSRDWACGVVDICYPINWDFGFTCATWWTKTQIWCFYRHRFTANGTFTIVS